GILAGVALGRLAELSAATSSGYRHFPTVALVVLLGLGIGRTVDRYPVWQDQFTLYQQTTIDAPLSYEAHYGYADLLAQMGRGQEAETEYRVAIQLFPEMEDGTVLARRTAKVYQDLGNLYRSSGLCPQAIKAYDKTLAQSASIEYNEVRQSLIACLLYEGDYRRAAAEARIGITGGWNNAVFSALLITADSALAVNALPSAVRDTIE
ncbi:MAG: tetratricopeptide repeat protein, partial [Gemmatimonadales bacterium]